MSINDPHHCHCFKLLEPHFDLLLKKLESNGFEDKLQFQNGQLFGLIKDINEEEQIHIKLMPSGQIEAEIEPSHNFPFAHLNQKHSYSGHNQIQHLLKQFGIPYIRNWSIPLSCLKPIIVKPFKPTHVKTILAVVVVTVIISSLAYALIRTRKS